MNKNTTMDDAAAQHYVDAFTLLSDARSSEPRWLIEQRKHALERFREVGFPDRRHEAWKYVQLRPLVSERYPAPTPAAPRDVSTANTSTSDANAIRKLSFDGLGGARCVFVDGHFCSELSQLNQLPQGLTLMSLRQAVAAGVPQIEQHFVAWKNQVHELYAPDHAFGELNLALFEDGIYCHAAPGTIVEQPIEVIYYSSGGNLRSSYTRNLIVAESNCQLRFVETYGGDESAECLNNYCTEFHVAPNSHVDHVKIQVESANSHHVAQTRVTQQRDSNFFTHFFSFGGQVVRHEIEARMLGTGGDCHMTGAYVGRNNSMIDNTTTLHHAVPHCHSREVYKGMLADRAEGAFTGKIYVHPDAQKTDAEQANDTLLLSDDASINSRPNLEIYADDVRCTHGATIGQINQDALFYLRARGIERARAMNMLTRAFAHEVFEGVAYDSVRQRLDQLLDAHLPAPVATR